MWGKIFFRKSVLPSFTQVNDKNFYIIIPLGESIFPQASGFFSRIFGGGKAREVSQRVENFEKAKEKLETRVSSILANLGGVGIRGVKLKTEEIIQLYYNSYNFEAGPIIDPTALKDIKIAG